MSAYIIDFCRWLQEALWGAPLLVFMLGIGIYFTVRTGFFQLRHIKFILKSTLFSSLKKKKRSDEGKELTPFQTLCTTLGATIGTGNIAGVATAITAGGAGAIFWMWVSGLLGTMIAYAENALGVYFREKGDDGVLRGGAMYCLKNGLKNKRLADFLGTLFAFFCVLASLGIGNTAQTNTITYSVTVLNPSVPKWVIGILVAAISFLVILGGVGRIARVTEYILPFMSIFYILGTLIIIFKNIDALPKAVALICNEALGLNSVLGGGAGAAVKKAVSVGFRRGVFSNEAGMGSLVIINSASSEKEPAVQGMWGIFEVAFDTLIMCSLTAFALLCSGTVDLCTGKILSELDGAALVTKAFSLSLGNFAGIFIAISMVFFAFSTLLGWSFYGIRCVEYLFGNRWVVIYKVIFSVSAYFGAVADLSFIWILSDIFNGLMAIPNLICLVLMSHTVLNITKNYSNRVFKAKNEAPMLEFNKHNVTG